MVSTLVYENLSFEHIEALTYGREWELGYDALLWFFFFQAEDGIRDVAVTGVQTCALPISFGQSLILSGKSGRGCALTCAATSNACWSVSVPGWSNGMFSRMNAAAVRTRVIPAPTLYDLGPHRGGATAVPCPSRP